MLTSSGDWALSSLVVIECGWVDWTLERAARRMYGYTGGMGWMDDMEFGDARDGDGEVCPELKRTFLPAAAT